MAVSFAAGSFALASWGFSAGDIAILAGAGRSIGTWVMAQVKDQTLLDFMKVDPEDLIPRKGVIDPTALHKRWDVSLTLLQNGRARTFENSGTPLIQNMPRFSWFMTLVVSGLDASLGIRDLRRVTSRFLTSLFAEHIESVDYILRELPHHLQGWMSAACVRNVSAKARSEWAALAERGVRMPGQIPSDDCQEVERLLIWLSGACGNYQERKFQTNSSDVYALALVLKAIGFDLISIHEPKSGGDESQLWVFYTPGVISMGRPTGPTKRIDVMRRGMRIPLNQMEECISLWPGTLEENYFRKLLFKRGMKAAENLKYTRDEKSNIFSWCCFTDFTVSPLEKGPSVLPEAHEDPRNLALESLSGAMQFFVQSIFPIVNSAILEEMSRITRDHPQWTPPVPGLDYLAADTSCLAEVQIFVMGYYYAMLKPLLDTSQLNVQEAYGDWGWNDHGLLKRIVKVLEVSMKESFKKSEPDQHRLSQEDIITLISILFAGAEEAQCDTIPDEVVGLHGKITVLDAIMLGYANTTDVLMKYHLLDLDSTAIPSNVKGIIISSTSAQAVNVPSSSSEDKLYKVGKAIPNALDEDLTSHIEPDWDNDVQCCNVVYRYKGRLVRRLSPRQIEKVNAQLNLEVQNKKRRLTAPGKKRSFDKPSKQIYLEGIESFFDSKYPVPDSTSSKNGTILFATQGCNKARTCLQAIYVRQGFVLRRGLEVCQGLEWIARSPETVVLECPRPKNDGSSNGWDTVIIL